MFGDSGPARKFQPGPKIAVVGSGIAGLSAAWLLSRTHDVTLYEAEARAGGHSHTIDAPSPDGAIPVDTGFIVYTEATYPNLTALFAHLGVATKKSEMSFAISLDNGALEYSGTSLSGLFAQKQNLLRPRFWTMLRDILRFYRQAPRDAATFGEMSLGDYLDKNHYSEAFRQYHLYPMAAAIWSLPAQKVADYPAAAFVDFCRNHGLLKIADRPQWRTVAGGARSYVDRLAASLAGRVRLSARVRSVARIEGALRVSAEGGEPAHYDHVVLACHADQSLALLANPTQRERDLLGAFAYSRNLSILHRDAALMPRRRAVWASWNYLADRADEAGALSVTYWMNRLQSIPEATPLFVTLNPHRQPRPELVIDRQMREHPQFDARAIAAQRSLWSLQGDGGLWYCGAYFGAGFHEDSLQSGLAVAEQLGGQARPWTLDNPSGRIALGPAPMVGARS